MNARVHDRPSPRSVAIIHHEHARRGREHLVSALGRLWRQRGLAVHHLYGTDEFVPADVAILHVDLSVVPEAYARFAACYPVALNANVLDIRKRTFSRLQLTDPTDYQGPVIVKTDLNAGGWPERNLRRSVETALPSVFRKGLALVRRILPWSAPAHGIVAASTYRVYPGAAQVPPSIYRDPRLIVERFVPERRGRLYCHRRYFFLADVEVNQLWLGTAAVCANDEDGVPEEEEIPVPADLRDFRRRIGIDYGKIDYVLGESGEVLVFDVNKTPGGACRNPVHEPWLRKLCADLEGGIGTVFGEPGTQGRHVSNEPSLATGIRA